MNTQPTPAPTPTIKRLKEELTGRDQDYGIVAELVDTLGFELAQAQAALAAKDREIERLNELNVRCAKDGIAHAKRAEKAEANLATSVAFVARLQERQRELMKEASDLWHERDQLRAEQQKVVAPVKNYLDEIRGLREQNDQLRARVANMEAQQRADTAELARMDGTLAAAKNTLREYLPQLAHEWDWKRNSTPANNREMAELDAAIDAAQAQEEKL